ALLESAVKTVTQKPIRWVLNTGAQDHRWLGNDYFQKRGAEVHALSGTVKTQKGVGEQQITGLQRFLGRQLEGTVPAYAQAIHPAPERRLEIDGIEMLWIETNAHYPGDALIHLPQSSVTFTGDLVYVDRILGVLPSSSVRQGQKGFAKLTTLAPGVIVPGHGRVTNLAQAKRETGDYYDFLIRNVGEGDYYDFLIRNVGEAARNMESLSETLNRFAKPAQFVHLENFSELHRANMNRVFTDFEANP
ncbi:MAG: hypothetical protein RL320_1846, partial [Pseudomonadota bacterium]